MECGICFVSADNKNIYAFYVVICVFLPLRLSFSYHRLYMRIYSCCLQRQTICHKCLVFHFRVNTTNDSINWVIQTYNAVYLYKYAFLSAYNRANKKPTLNLAKSRIFWWNVAYALCLQTTRIYTHVQSMI